MLVDYAPIKLITYVCITSHGEYINAALFVISGLLTASVLSK